MVTRAEAMLTIGEVLPMLATCGACRVGLERYTAMDPATPAFHAWVIAPEEDLDWLFGLLGRAIHPQAAEKHRVSVDAAYEALLTESRRAYLLYSGAKGAPDLQCHSPEILNEYAKRLDAEKSWLDLAASEYERARKKADDSFYRSLRTPTTFRRVVTRLRALVASE